MPKRGRFDHLRPSGRVEYHPENMPKSCQSEIELSQEIARLARKGLEPEAIALRLNEDTPAEAATNKLVDTDEVRAVLTRLDQEQATAERIHRNLDHAASLEGVLCDTTGIAKQLTTRERAALRVAIKMLRGDLS